MKLQFITFRNVSTKTLLGLTLLTTAAAGPVHAGQISLNWVNVAPDASGVAIERAADTSGAFQEIATVAGGVATFTDQSVADSTAYCYRLRAFTAEAFSDYSEPACWAAIDVTLLSNLPEVSNGDFFSVQAQVRVKAGFANPVDAYISLRDAAGSIYPLAIYEGVSMPNSDFQTLAIEGTVSDFAPGPYTVSLVVVRSGGHSQAATDQVSNTASLPFSVR